MSKITRRHLLASSAIAGILAAGEAKARFLGGQPAPTGAQSIISVSPSTGSFAGGTGSAGTVIATATATMSPSSPAFSGSWSLSGTNAASFAINSTTGVLSVGASDVAVGVYNVNIIATQVGATGSPFSQACTITGSSVTGVIAAADTSNEGATVSNKPFMFGQTFAKGDMPSGFYPLLKTTGAVTLTTQIEEIGPRYADGSMRHCVLFGINPNSVAGGTAFRTNIHAQASYSPSTPRSASEITSGHAFKIKYQEVVDHVSATVGSGNFTFDVNTAIAAGPVSRTSPANAVGYDIHWNGPVVMGVIVCGFFTDDAGGTSDRLYCEWYFEIYSDPANSANVLYIEHMPFVSQPFMDITSPDLMVGRMIVMDGATTLRDFGAETFSTGPSQMSSSVLGVAPDPCMRMNVTAAPWAVQDSEGFRVSLQAGAGNALPGGLTSGQRIWLQIFNAGAGISYVSTDPRGDQNFLVHFTNTGTAGGGTPTPFVFSSTQMVNSYQGIFLPADNNGTPWRTGSAWPDFEFCQDKTDNGTAQKAYAEKSGVWPGWDLTLGTAAAKYDAAIFINNGGNFANFQGSLYRPGTKGMYSGSIGGGGTNYDYGTGCEWDAHCFVRQGVSNWTRSENQFWRSMALTASCLPVTQVSRTAYARLPIVNNNGPHQYTTPPYTSGSGGTYPGLGPSDPDVRLTTGGNNAGIALPVGFGGGWHNAPFVDNSALVVDHWPITCWAQYAHFGKRYFRDQLDRQAHHQMLCNGWGVIGNAVTSNNLIEGTWRPLNTVPNCASNYTFYTRIAITGEERDDMGCLPLAYASVLGAATRPQVAWWQDYIMSVYIFWDYYYNHLMHQGNDDINPGIKTTGYWLWGRDAAEPWMMQGYGAMTYAMMRNITRHPLAGVPVEAVATNGALFWSGASGTPLYFIPGYERYYGNRRFAPFVDSTIGTYGGYGRGSVWPTSQQVFYHGDGYTLDTTGIFEQIHFAGGIGNSNSPGTQTGTSPLANGDEIVIITGTANGSPTTYTGPSQYNPDTTYFVCQFGTAGANKFRLTPTASDPTGVNAITTSTAFAGISLGTRYHTYNPAPGTGTGLTVLGNNTEENNSFAMCKGAFYEIQRGGTPAISNPSINWNTALTNIAAWDMVGSSATPIADGGLKYRTRTTNSVQ